MKNLNLLSFNHASIPELKDVECHLSVDVDTDTIYLNTSNEIIGVDIEKYEKKFAVGLSEVSKNSAKVVGLQYVQGDENICAALNNGDLCLINVITKTVECVGTVDSGLVAMKWSPDQEIVLLGTGHDSIIAMTRDFDPLTEVNLFAKEFGQGEFITVGWGKKETQFHGTEGKRVAHNKIAEIHPAATWDDRKIRMAWRGDGQYFAVSMIDPLNFNRKFCVWNRECVLQYTSENMNGLESAFAWKPSGSLLASSQRKPHRHDIVFFEKNGLQHGEFTLPFAKDEVLVKTLEWNADSSILVIWMVDHIVQEMDKPANNYLQLWMVSNYHWYLKQSFRFSADKAPSAVQWDPEHSNRLHVICVDGHYRQYVFCKMINDSTAPKYNVESLLSEKECEENLSYVAVIDGESVLMTPFSKMVVPPPMCAFKLTLPHSANAVCFLLSKQHPNDVCVVLNNFQVAIYKTTEALIPSVINKQLSVQLDAAGGNGFLPRASSHKPVALLTIQVSDNIDVSALHHWLWINDNQMFAISPCSIPGTDLGLLFIIDYDKAELCLSKSIELDGLVLSVHKCAPEKIAMQLSNGKLVLFDMKSFTLGNLLTAAGNALTIPRPCVYVSSCTFDGTECTVALSENSRLYIDETEVASDCSSFCIHNDFLFLTTHAHLLKCIYRNVSLENVLKYYNTPAESRSTLLSCAITESYRAIERGSRIVTVTPSDSRLILQMPRGNLELINPRCLVLSLVYRYIKSLRFSDAFTVMKKHRINMNLLCDVDRELFENNVEHFVNDLDQPTDINIFISDLHDDDYTTTMYKQYFSKKIGNESQVVASGSICQENSQKVNKTCDLLIAVLQKDFKRFIMSLITAHVKKNPSEVGQALARIKELTESSDVNEKLISHLIKYMSVLVESNQLFDEALGTYDFKLVMMVAEKSEKDPKEYMPILHELNKLDENYRKYKIDLKLKRYSKALHHITKCEDYFHECVQLIEDHSLYKKALELYALGTPRYKKICSMYGLYLQKKKLYDESGIIFSRCDELHKALDCFVLAANCSLALSTAFTLHFTKEQLTELSYKLAEQAKNAGHPEDAVNMLENYASDVELAVEAALNAHMWQQAIRMTAQHGRSDLNETHVKPALRESFDHTCQTLNNYKLTFIKQTSRLQEVRQNKERLHMQMLYDGCGEMGRDSDLYSDTSSTAAGSTTSRSSSNVSRTTGKTSKSRRRKERRDYSLKEGSRFEDLALLRSLKLTAKNVNELRETVRSLSISLASFGLNQEAQQLQNIYSDVCNTLSKLLPAIWTQNLLNSTTVTGVESTVNSILSSVQNRRSAISDVDENEKHNYEDLDLFIPPAFVIGTSWKMNLFEQA